uniref:Uncharacterized protein n=2 Tax=Oryza TaxID=4527 RepID=A0A1V1H086_9ORYZ|nr:hypothetical protein [Oryza glaberrima]BAX24790.1 hypothetical protein [Oryza barthii]
MAYVQVRRALCRVARRARARGAGWGGGIGLASRERPQKWTGPRRGRRGGHDSTWVGGLGRWRAVEWSGVEWRADASTRPVCGGEPGRDMRFGQKWAGAVTKEAYVDEWSVKSLSQRAMDD